MKLVYTVGITYGIAELIHQIMYLRRYYYFNNLRIPNTEPLSAIQTMVQIILKNNSMLFQRASLYKHFTHIRNENDLCDAMIPRIEETPVNLFYTGSSKLYMRYLPFAIKVFMKTLRQTGTLYMRWVLGYSRTWHMTEDGYYSVWTHTVAGTKPFVFFPGFGLGATPYAKLAKTFGRTVHIVEVPNIGYAMSLSNSEATPKTLYEVVSKHVADGPDIFAHSIGSTHAAMYLNMIQDKDTPKHNVTICDGYVDLCDTLINHLYPFVGFGDYHNIRKKPKNWYYFIRFIYFVVYDLEFQIVTKRYHKLYHGTLWRDYPNAKITYVYSKYDILYDTEYIANNSDCVFIPKGSHGYSIFGSGSSNLRF